LWWETLNRYIIIFLSSKILKLKLIESNPYK
jgi:4-hydroxyphenylpyruvate dioxygenase